MRDRPQLEPKAIQHLCTALGIDAVLVDERNHSRTAGVDGTQILQIPSYETTVLGSAFETRRIAEIACFFHTSGTSSGLPKPIPQSHAMVSALPRSTHHDQPATFTTTPLYHGGLADCLRAWTSGAMVWFFPEGVAPITEASILKAVGFAQGESAVPIKYFSSVPYILQMLSENEDGISLLQKMDLVGVGGAALPPAIGDRLVDKNVRLLSRMGSAECGFLMSSHRDYSADREWQYLRPIADSNLVTFESRDGGLSELVVQPGWPFKVKTNRDDDSYATSDLFEPHASIPNAWRYHSRADAQITLANGKKFDPAPTEGSILASTNLLQDVLIFGSGKDYVGVLLFPTSAVVSEERLLDAVWPCIDEINAGSQSHSRITRPMLVVVPVKNGEKPLEKSSKGTVMRRRAEEKYSEFIESAYTSKTSASVTDDQLLDTVLDCFSQVLGSKVNTEKDLYQQGVDSMSCVQIRKMVESRCLPGSRQLPMNIVYDKGTVNALVEHLRLVRQGALVQDDDKDARPQAMKDLAEKYSDFKGVQGSQNRKLGRVVVLTGATGFLGTHILHLLREDTAIKRIICLVRAQILSAANERVTEALCKRGMAGLVDFDAVNVREGKVVCLPAHLSSPKLGLENGDYEWVLEQMTHFVHSAWTVNFALRLGSFEDQVAAARNLLDVAARGGARFVFVSSTAAVTSARGPIPETVSFNPSDASPLGYSQSKWVAEQVCVAAGEAIHGLSVCVIRVGQLCGNEAGVWNASEAYPLMLSTARITGCLPDIPHEVLSWLPVEVAARAVVEGAFGESGESGESGEALVYHVVNVHTRPTWKKMLEWISEKDSGLEVVGVTEWLGRLEKALESKDHPSQALLGLWKGMEGGQEVVFEMEKTERALVTMRDIEPLGRERVVRIWEWVNENV